MKATLEFEAPVACDACPLIKAGYSTGGLLCAFTNNDVTAYMDSRHPECQLKIEEEQMSAREIAWIIEVSCFGVFLVCAVITLIIELRGLNE